MADVSVSINQKDIRETSVHVSAQLDKVLLSVHTTNVAFFAWFETPADAYLFANNLAKQATELMVNTAMEVAE